MLLDENPRIPTLGGVAAAAGAGFAVLTALERDRRLSKPDKKAMRAMTKRLRKHAWAAELLHPAGKWWSYVPAAAAAGALVYAKGNGRQSERIAGAAAILLAAAVGALINPLFDKLLPQPETPPGRKSDPEPSFPSGHTFGLGAVALSAAYVLEREGVIDPPAAAAIALLPPLIGGAARVVQEKHWPSEVVGGILVAVVIASLSILVYELERAQP